MSASPVIPAPFVIEKNIPIKQRVKNSRYPFDIMELGDSFFVPVGNEHRTAAVGARLRTCAYAHGKRRGMFSFRKVDGGLRCWRVK